jgi:DNA-binding CsgD family transcriptional regulator
MNGGEGEPGNTQPPAPHIAPERAQRAVVGGLEILTVRERQVVSCLARGLSTKEVAFSLGIADATVRVLLARAASKLGVRSREAVLLHPAVVPLRQAEGGPPPLDPASAAADPDETEETAPGLESSG